MRTEIDVNLLVQAVIALGEQLQAEAQEREQAAAGQSVSPSQPAEGVAS